MAAKVRPALVISREAADVDRPVSIRTRGAVPWNPHFTAIAGWPVRFVSPSVASLPAESGTSNFVMNSARCCISTVRPRCARR
jgi:hypothetical protein